MPVDHSPKKVAPTVSKFLNLPTDGAVGETSEERSSQSPSDGAQERRVSRLEAEISMPKSMHRSTSSPPDVHFRNNNEGKLT